MCSKAREILVEECNVQRVDAPVTVEGLDYVGSWKVTRKPKSIFFHGVSSGCDSETSEDAWSWFFADLRRHSWAVLRFGGAL